VYDWLRAQPGDFAILQLPIYEKGADAWAMLWAIHHGKRLVNGHGGFPLPTWVDLVDAADSRDPDRVASAIRTIYPLRYVIVQRNLGLGRTWRPVADLIRAGRVPVLALVWISGPDEVYAVTPTPETGVVLRRHFSSDFVRRHSRATYVARLAGEDPEVRRRVEVRLNGRLLGTVGGPAPEGVTLTPPFPDADRNELAFRHVYEVPASLVRTDAYRIGRTGRHSPVDLDVRGPRSADGRFASVRVNGLELVGSRGRGYWIAALAPTDGRVLGVRAFEVQGGGGAPEGLASFIEGWPEGTIVVAVATEGPELELSEGAVRALRSIGGRADLRGTSGLSHVLIGARGAGPGEALEEWGPRAVRVAVGKDRPLGVTLEAFELH
jgi:hypothetical protein